MTAGELVDALEEEVLDGNHREHRSLLSSDPAEIQDPLWKELASAYRREVAEILRDACSRQAGRR